MEIKSGPRSAGSSPNQVFAGAGSIYSPLRGQNPLGDAAFPFYRQLPIRLSNDAPVASVYDTWSRDYESDGMDSDGDGLIDEGTDGVDNDGDAKSMPRIGSTTPMGSTTTMMQRRMKQMRVANWRPRAI